jgi:hypothetical protein
MSQQRRNDRKNIQNKKNRLLPWLVFFCLLLVLATMVLVVLIRNHVEAAKGSDYPLGINAVSGFDCDYSEAQRIYPFEEGLLKVTATRVVYMSVTGTEIYSYDFNMEDPQCVVKGSYALVADQGGFAYACFTNGGMVYSGSVPGKIGFSDVSSEGYCALIIEDENANGSVWVMNASGETIAQWKSVESGYPISACFSPKSTSISIALVDTDASQMKPNLKQIRIPAPSSSEKPYDYAFVSSEDSIILPMITYTSDDHLFWSGISKVYSLSEGILNEVSSSFPNLISVIPLEGKAGVFYSEGIGQQILFACVDSSANVSAPIVLGNQLKAQSAYQKYILIAVDDRLLLVDTGTCTIDKERTVDEDIIRVLLSSNDRVIVVTSSGVREIRF